MRQVVLRVLFAGVPLLLAGCAEMQLGAHMVKQATNEPAPYHAPAITEKRKVGKPYDVMGKTYYPVASSDGFSEKGVASWYGKDFHGKKTANGEEYDMYTMTAAHPTLPLPTFVRVTNLNNGRSAVVKVNDRGPFLRSRVIDMSYAAAHQLGYMEQGTAPVLVEALPADGSELDPSKRVTQIAAVPANSAPVQTASLGGDKFTTRVYERDHPNGAGVDYAKDTAEVVKGVPIAHVETEEDLRTVRIGKTSTYVQVAAFGDPANAEKQRVLLAEQYPDTRIVRASVNGKNFFRVRVGPLATTERADDVLGMLLSRGFNGAQIVVD